jgi:hypothetical protein
MFLLKAVCNTCGQKIDNVEEGVVFYNTRWRNNLFPGKPGEFVVVHGEPLCEAARNALHGGIWERTTLTKFLERLPREYFRYANKRT